jgi:hypothetical protein
MDGEQDVAGVASLLATRRVPQAAWACTVRHVTEIVLQSIVARLPPTPECGLYAAPENGAFKRSVSCAENQTGADPSSWDRSAGSSADTPGYR